MLESLSLQYQRFSKPKESKGIPRPKELVNTAAETQPHFRATAQKDQEERAKLGRARGEKGGKCA
jgi:hypothetical protein